MADPDTVNGALTAFHFLRPWWLLAAVPVLWAAWRWSTRSGAGSHWEARIAPELLAVLLEPGSRGPARRLPWLVAAALLWAVAALAGPAWERLPQPVEKRSDSLIVLFDLSLSLFAQDVAPSRLVRARQKIADVLRRREEGFTALVAYAGDAHAVVPLTDDTRTIENLLGALRPDMMPVLGSRVGSALEQAHGLFENAGVSRGRILVVTDSIDELSDVLEWADRNFPISFLGIGTTEGGPIPLDFVNQPGQVLRSQQGDPIVPRLDPARLTMAAEGAYGRYRTLTLGDDDIDDLLATPLPGEDETAEVERDFDTWADRGYLLALLLVPLVLLGFRRGAVALIPLLALPIGSLVAPAAEAGLWDDLWQRRDQQAYGALERGEPEPAVTLIGPDDAGQDWRAAALYRSGEFAAAADAYRRQADTRALYNLGNALAQQQAFDAAIAAYDEVLTRQPGHEDAAFNKALVERLRDQEEASEQNQSPQDPSDGEPPPDQPPPQGEGDAQQSDEGADADQQPQEQNADQESEQQGEPQESEPESSDEQLAASRDEKRDALEQWLRRVPDDPGGLLRRKFQYETNQRLRRGDYRSQETEKIW